MGLTRVSAPGRLRDLLAAGLSTPSVARLCCRRSAGNCPARFCCCGISGETSEGMERAALAGTTPASGTQHAAELHRE
jgi:hypothetical protein